MSNLLTYGPHIIAGVLALGLFWRTILSAKGSAPHRRYGRLYILVLVPLMLSVIPIFLEELQTEGPVRIVQLVYLFIVVSTAGWTAWRAVKDRHRPERFKGPVFRTLAVLMTGFGVLLMVLGIAADKIMPFGFGTIGLVYGGAMLGHLGRAPQEGWWLRWHLNGVCLLFAATHASFSGLVIGRLVPAWEGEVLHGLTQFGAVAIAYLLRQWMERRYGSISRSEAAALPQMA